ncbi:hypothetical protein COLO4_01296, partial [Corchorus olitorius]
AQGKGLDQMAAPGRRAGRSLACGGAAAAARRRAHPGLCAGAGPAAGAGAAALALLLLLPCARLVRVRRPARRALHPAGAGRGLGGHDRGAGQLGGRAPAWAVAARHAHRSRELGAGPCGPGLWSGHVGLGLVHQRPLVPAGRGLARGALCPGRHGPGLRAGVSQLEPAVQPGHCRCTRHLAAGPSGLWRRAGAATGRAGPAGGLGLAHSWALGPRTAPACGRTGAATGPAPAVDVTVARPLERRAGRPGRGPDRGRRHRAHAAAGRDHHAGQH